MTDPRLEPVRRYQPYRRRRRGRVLGRGPGCCRRAFNTRDRRDRRAAQAGRDLADLAAGDLGIVAATWRCWRWCRRCSPSTGAFRSSRRPGAATWRWHLLASVVFSALHVALMVAMRKVVYACAGSSYDFGDWLAQVGYEYLKDVRTYALILVRDHGLPALLLRLQGEARVLDAPEARGRRPAAPARRSARRRGPSASWCASWATNS